MIDNNSDRCCLAMLHALRIGDHKAFNRAITELERLQMYAKLNPTHMGFGNLLHMLRMLQTHFLLTTKEGERAMPTLVSSSEAESYDPHSRTAKDQRAAEEALRDVLTRADEFSNDRWPCGKLKDGGPGDPFGCPIHGEWCPEDDDGEQDETDTEV